MTKSELNIIILKKIAGLDDSSNMKSFIINILDLERQNIVYLKTRYTEDYIRLANEFIKKEKKENVDIRNKNK